MEVVNALQGLLVTQPCGHGFHDPLTISPFYPETAAEGGPPDQNRYWKDRAGTVWHVRGDLYQRPSCSWERNPDGPFSDVFSLCPVDGNEAGQWASLAFCSQEEDREGMLVWQKGACLACVRNRVSRQGSCGAFQVHQIVSGTVSV
jgi:hypothetical protein